MRATLLAGFLIAAPLTAAAQPPGEPSDAAIDERLRASAAAAQSLQGPLDGGWTLVGASGAAIYAFQFVDPPGGSQTPEGVWRDLRRPMTPGDIGPVDSLVRSGATLTLRFSPIVGKGPTVVALKAGADGAWTGELREDDAAPTAVTLKQN